MAGFLGLRTPRSGGRNWGGYTHRLFDGEEQQTRQREAEGRDRVRGPSPPDSLGHGDAQRAKASSDVNPSDKYSVGLWRERREGGREGGRSRGRVGGGICVNVMRTTVVHIFLYFLYTLA